MTIKETIKELQRLRASDDSALNWYIDKAKNQLEVYNESIKLIEKN